MIDQNHRCPLQPVEECSRCALEEADQLLIPGAFNVHSYSYQIEHHSTSFDGTSHHIYSLTSEIVSEYDHPDLIADTLAWNGQNKHQLFSIYTMRYLADVVFGLLLSIKSQHYISKPIWT